MQTRHWMCGPRLGWSGALRQRISTVKCTLWYALVAHEATCDDTRIKGRDWGGRDRVQTVWGGRRSRRTGTGEESQNSPALCLRQDVVFGSIRWSPDERYLVYVAESKPSDTVGWWDKPKPNVQPGAKVSAASTSLGPSAVCGC